MGCGHGRLTHPAPVGSAWRAPVHACTLLRGLSGIFVRVFLLAVKREETQLAKSSIVGLRPFQQRAQRPVCLPGPADREPTRAVAVTKSPMAGRAQSSPLLLGDTWTGPLIRAFFVFTWGLILCMSLMFSNFFVTFLFKSNVTNGIFCDPRGPMNEPEFRAHVLDVCNLLPTLHVNPLPKRMPQGIKTNCLPTQSVPD